MKVVFDDEDLKNSLVRNLIANVLGLNTTQLGQQAPLKANGSAEHSVSPPVNPVTAEPLDHGAEAPAPKRGPGRPAKAATEEPAAEPKRRGRPPKVATEAAPAAPSVLPPGVGAPPAAMPAATAPTGDSPTDLLELARALDERSPGGSFRILSESNYFSTSQIPFDRTDEFVAKYRMAIAALG